MIRRSHSPYRLQSHLLGLLPSTLCRLVFDQDTQRFFLIFLLVSSVTHLLVVVYVDLLLALPSLLCVVVSYSVSPINQNSTDIIS